MCTWGEDGYTSRGIHLRIYTWEADTHVEINLWKADIHLGIYNGRADIYLEMCTLGGRASLHSGIYTSVRIDIWIYTPGRQI